MRKRTLYVSELVKRNYNKELQIVITYKQGVLTFYTRESILSNKDICDRQVEKWSLSHSTLTQTLHIKLASK